MVSVASRMTEEQYNYIFKEVVGTCLYLPSETSGVIVNWEKPDQFRISAILPATTRKAHAYWTKARGTRPVLNTPREFNMDTPALMLSATFGNGGGPADEPPIPLTDRFRRQPPACSQVDIVAINTDIKDKIMIRPYRPANVHENSKICFGSNNAPRTLREAHNTFWSAPFNCDFGGPNHNNRCPKIVHRGPDHDKPLSIHRHMQVGLCRCGYDRTGHNGYEFLCRDCGGFKYDMVSLPDAVKDELKARHQRIGSLDLCSVGLCRDEKNHSTNYCYCRCPCCMGGCKCACECELTDEFIKGLQDYAYGRLSPSPWPHFTPLTQVPWEDWTKQVCGKNYNYEKSQFFSYSGKCDGVFVSYHPKFVADHKDVARKHGNRDCVIGVIRISGTTATIDLGKKEIALSLAKVAFIGDKWESPLEHQKRVEAEYAAEQERLQRVREATRAQNEARRLAEARRTSEINASIRSRVERSGRVATSPEVTLWEAFFRNNQAWFDRENRPITSSYA